MADTSWAVAFGSAVAGAVVGGAASLAGSVVVQRRQVVRETRLKIYREILPDLVEDVMNTMADQQVERDFRELVRLCALVGRSPRELAENASNDFDSIRLAPHSAPDAEGRVVRDPKRAERSEVRRELVRLEESLRTKLRAVL